MTAVSIVGCGYAGLRLARLHVGRGDAVRGFATRPQSLRDLEAAGATAGALDLDRAVPPLDAEGRIVYYLAPPAPDGDRDPRLTRLLGALAGAPRRVVYMSTTGVYGDHDGGWVDESTPPQPRTPRARRRLAAETTLRDWCGGRGLSWCILRVAGIYGPGRLPMERLRRGEPAIMPQEARPTNRIHVADLARACLAAGLAGCASGRIYNVTDGNDDSQTAYLQRVARLCGLPPPPLLGREAVRLASSPGAWSFLSESRRVDNRRMLEELGVALEYRDLDAGILASLQG
ncbi:MAG: SDR family oxidoreductase [Gammaproteobacteria bacterium]|nr:SDR family oxidoreductase [Gammaproteobacteria bacterium]